MPGWKRSLANFIGKVLGAELVSRKGIRQGDVFVTNSADIPLSLERCHLRRFFQHFEVDCIFDVGANAGQYAELARSLGFTGPIISYEPIPAVARELRRKAKRDGNWYVEELALDDAERQATFHVMAGSQFSSLKLPSEAETDRFDKQNIVTEEVSLTTARLADQYDDYVRLPAAVPEDGHAGQRPRRGTRSRGQAPAFRGAPKRARFQANLRRPVRLSRRARLLSLPGIRAERAGAEQSGPFPRPH
jgi:FkbM family methyltransferase